MNVDPIDYANDMAIIFRVLKKRHGRVSDAQVLALASNLVSAQQSTLALALGQRYLRDGSSLSASLAKTGYFPTMAVEMLKVHEQLGAESKALSKTAKYFKREAKAKRKAMSEIVDAMIANELGHY